MVNTATADDKSRLTSAVPRAAHSAARAATRALTRESTTDTARALSREKTKNVAASGPETAATVKAAATMRTSGAFMAVVVVRGSGAGQVPWGPPAGSRVDASVGSCSQPALSVYLFGMQWTSQRVMSSPWGVRSVCVPSETPASLGNTQKGNVNFLCVGATGWAEPPIEIRMPRPSRRAGDCP